MPRSSIKIYETIVHGIPRSFILALSITNFCWLQHRSLSQDSQPSFKHLYQNVFEIHELNHTQKPSKSYKYFPQKYVHICSKTCYRCSDLFIQPLWMWQSHSTHAHWTKSASNVNSSKWVGLIIHVQYIPLSVRDGQGIQPKYATFHL